MPGGPKKKSGSKKSKYSLSNLSPEEKIRRIQEFYMFGMSVDHIAARTSRSPAFIQSALEGVIMNKADIVRVLQIKNGWSVQKQIYRWNSQDNFL